MEPKRPHDRQKMNYACEACRAAKIKCQSGAQPGICKRCCDFKRECIFRTGPRTRRPKSTIRASAEATMPPPGPSKTFSIDFEIPLVEEPIDDFEALRRRHERYLDNLGLNEDKHDDQQQLSSGEVTKLASQLSEPKSFSFADMSSSSPSLLLSGRSSSTTRPTIGSQRSKPLVNLGIQPQFNLDSASKLLVCFRDMLPNMPCLVLPEDVDVKSLATNSPFVLLAILATTSCSNSLQGHSLYDEEFRKVFGLKFVAGGERSLELLQGLLVYCSWYPFHLRPRNKQAFQYLRMAVDIYHDLEPDQELELFSTGPGGRAPSLDNIRAFLACFYAISSFSSIWGKTSTLRYGPQIARSAEILERNSSLEQDHHLVWLVRQQYIFEELAEVQRSFHRGPRDHQSEMQRDLIRTGLEAQFHDFKARMPAEYAATTSIRLSSLITEVLIQAPPLINASRKPTHKGPPETLTPERLLTAAHKVRAFFDHITSLPPSALSALSVPDYGRFIFATVMAYRLSFPMVGICDEYDVAQGQRILDFGEILRKLIEASPSQSERSSSSSGSSSEKKPANHQPKQTDALSAFKLVLQSVKNKFDEKKAAAAAAFLSRRDRESDFSSSSTSLCPMLNGTLGQHMQMPLWTDGGPGISDPFVGPMTQMGLGEDKALMPHDLWTTMTHVWPGDVSMGVEDIEYTDYDETFTYLPTYLSR